MVTDATSRNFSPPKSCSSGSCAASTAIPRAALWIALSASHGRAECPARPLKVHVALMLPRQPAWMALSVGSIITTSSAAIGSRASSGVRALSAIGSSSRPKSRQSRPTPASASSSITATAPFMSLAPSPWTRSASRRPGRLPWAGTVSRWPASRTGAPGPASTQVSPRSRTVAPPPRSTPMTCSARGASARLSDGMSTSSSVLAASRSPSSPSLIAVVIGLPPYRPPLMRYCGIDVSAKAGNQQLCTLHERRGPDGLELVTTFYEPGTVKQIARTVHGFGLGQAVVAVDAPSGHRLDLLAAGEPLRAELGLPEGRYERMRVCDTLLFRRGLPLYPVPSAEQPRSAWQDWMQVGFELFAALGEQRLYHPPEAAYEGRVGDAALAHGRLCETYPDAIFCTLLGHRPSAKRT